MLQSRLLKTTVNHLLFQKGKWFHVPNSSQYQQVRKKLIYPMNKGQIRVLMDILDVRYRKAYGISRQHTNLRTIDQIMLYKSADMLNKFELTKDDLLAHPQMLSILPITIENHAMLLQEGGFSAIRPNHLIRFITMMRKPIKLFKVYNYIPNDVDVHNNFFSHLEDPPPPLELPNSDESDFLNVYLAALSHYLCWKLEMSKEDLERLVIIYPRLKYRSFRLMESSLNVLEKQLGFTKEKIKRNGYLIHCHPQNTLDILEKIKSLGGMDIKTVLQKHPKIITMSTDALLKTNHYLQDFGIPDEAIQRCPEVYTLSSETVNERLQALRSIPEFMGLITNPRILRLVHHQRRAASRLESLDRIKYKCVSLHLLQASQAVFDKFLRDGSDKTHGNDAVIYLANEFECDKEKIRKLLHRHPFWCNVPLVTILETLNFLRDKGFTKEQILFSFQILLYARKQVEKHLQDLPYHPEICRELLRQNDLGNAMEFSREQQLALCLYFIERDHHFSGDGIWFENPHITSLDDAPM